MNLPPWAVAVSSTVWRVQTQKPPEKVCLSPSALSPGREEKSSNNNTCRYQTERQSDQLSSKEMMILSAKTMISLHLKTKGILKAKHSGRTTVGGLKQKFPSPVFFTGPAKKEQALRRDDIMVDYTIALCLSEKRPGAAILSDTQNRGSPVF